MQTHQGVKLLYQAQECGVFVEQRCSLNNINVKNVVSSWLFAVLNTTLMRIQLAKIVEFIRCPILQTI